VLGGIVFLAISLIYFSLRSSVDVVGGETGQNDRDNQTVQTESLSENENEDHTDVDVLLGVGTDTGITSDTDGETGSEGRETAAKT